MEFQTLMEYFKEHQTMTPIIDIYYAVYVQRMEGKSQSPEVFWEHWKSVPLSHL